MYERIQEGADDRGILKDPGNDLMKREERVYTEDGLKGWVRSYADGTAERRVIA